MLTLRCCILVPQDAISFTIDFLVKFKRGSKAPRVPGTPWFEEAMVSIFDFLSPPKLHLFSQISQNLFDIWLCLQSNNFLVCTPIFSYYAAIVAHPVFMLRTNQ
jgi:hypothetical protein